MADVVVLHQLTHSCDRADTILGICKEQFWHHISLQVHLLLHMAGRIARHVGVKTDLQLPQLSPHCFWDHPNLRCQAAKLFPTLFYPEGFKQACSLVCTNSTHVHSRWQQKVSCRHKDVHTHTCCFALQSMKAGAMADFMSVTCMCQCQGCVAARWEPCKPL